MKINKKIVHLIFWRTVKTLFYLTPFHPFQKQPRGSFTAPGNRNGNFLIAGNELGFLDSSFGLKQSCQMMNNECFM